MQFERTYTPAITPFCADYGSKNLVPLGFDVFLEFS